MGRNAVHVAALSILMLCGAWDHHKKNTALEVALPMVDSSSPESFKSGVSPTDTAYYKDGSGSWTSLAITDTFAEIGSTGVYQISLTASECNHDWIVIEVTATGAADTLVAYRMFADDIDSVASTAGNIETDTQDIQSRIPAALVGGRMASDAVAISGSTTAADAVESDIGNLDAAVSTRSTVTTAQVNTEVETALADIGLDHLVVRQGTAQSGGAAYIQLDAGASATDDLYATEVIVITGGTGVGQANRIDSYAGAGKTAYVGRSWETVPDATSTFVILAGGPTAEFGSQAAADANAAVDAALDTAISDTPTSNSINQRVRSLDLLLESGGSGSAASILTNTNNLRTDYTTTRAGYLDYLSGGAVATAASIAALNDPSVAEIWGADLPGAYSGADAGYIVGTYLDAAVSSRSDFDEASDPVELVTTGGSAGTDAGELVDLIWDEGTAGHADNGTTGKKIAEDIWGTHTGGAFYSAGEAGYYLDAKVSDGCILPTFPDNFADMSITATTGLVSCSGGGSGTTITLGPLVAAREPGNRITSPITLEMFEYESKTFAITVVDADGDPVDLSALTLRFVVYTQSNPPTGKFDVEEANIDRNGTNVALVNVPAASADFADEDLRWVLRNTATGEVLAHGPFAIVASVDDVP